MVIFTKFGLRRLRWILEDLEEQVFDWKMNSQSNTIRWVLTHISLILNVYFPRGITGKLDYYPPYLPKPYLNNLTLTHQKILTDIKEGEKIILDQLNSLNPESLSEILDWYLGPQEREFYLMILCSEILHHGGQISAILGNWQRSKGIKPQVKPSI